MTHGQAVVDVYATEPHFVNHMLPIWRAMPPELRGAFYTRREYDPGILGEPRSERAGHGDLFLVCSFGDLRMVTATSTRTVIFSEHGAGFTFANEYGYVYRSYAGADDRPCVGLFLNVNDTVQRANARAHPHARGVVIGSPKMDQWYNPKRFRPQTVTGADVPTVAIAFHWDGHILSPGIGNAFNHFRSALPALAARTDIRLVGHAHPRFATEMQMECMALNIPYVERLDDVFRQADVLVADATSAMYEFASLDRPVVTMNTPEYRREPDRGIRFWQHIPGIQVDEPEDLAQATLNALDDPPELQAIRRSAVEAVYPIRGDAAQRAVSAIADFVDLCHRSETDDPTQQTYHARVRDSVASGGGGRRRPFEPIEEDVFDVTQEVSPR